MNLNEMFLFLNENIKLMYFFILYLYIVTFKK